MRVGNRNRNRRSRKRASWGRKRLWQGLGASAVLLGVCLALPLILVNRFEPWEAAKLLPISLQPKETLAVPAEPMTVSVYRTERQATVDLPLEQYVRGVLAAEMPAEFELEALKAQAIAARTYLARRMASGYPAAADMPPEAGRAIVTDTVQHQVFYSEDQLRDQWGMFGYARNMDKLTRAVNETAGLILTYEGEPIQATFFSTSNGFTEDSEHYWSEKVPYLRSVESPWDRLYSPYYERTVRIPFDVFYDRLQLPKTTRAPALKAVKTSETGRLLEIDVNGERLDGRTFRERLGLFSSAVMWKMEEKAVKFTTNGYGHGVGMSQWGANGMAKQGKSAEEILRHYYTGVDIEPIGGKLANKL